MKPGNACRSIEMPKEGFTFRREGYKIFISYVEPNSICKVESNDSKDVQYDYIKYDYYGAINSYEELINKCILLKYTIEKEISLIAKAMIDSTNDEYAEYRNYVKLCKDECSSIYSDLGLNKKEK